MFASFIISPPPALVFTKPICKFMRLHNISFKRAARGLEKQLHRAVLLSHGHSDCVLGEELQLWVQPSSASTGKRSAVSCCAVEQHPPGIGQQLWGAHRWFLHIPQQGWASKEVAVGLAISSSNRNPKHRSLPMEMGFGGLQTHLSSSSPVF